MNKLTITLQLIAVAATTQAQDNFPKEIAGTMQFQGMYRQSKLGPVHESYA